MGDGSSRFLLERQEQSGGQRERGEPQLRDRGEVVLAEGPDADLEEEIARHPRHQQSHPDREGALGQGE